LERNGGCALLCDPGSSHLRLPDQAAIASALGSTISSLFLPILESLLSGVSIPEGPQLQQIMQGPARS
jgi:hypothetical protein